MPTKSKVIGFSAARMKRDMMKIVVTEQTDRLIEYAMAKIGEIGDRIQEYHSANHMDRYGNLLDSLCWGVAYDGKLKASGFYRDEAADRESYLHEWFTTDVISSMFPIYGHGLAQQYIENYNGDSGKGWSIFFAILAPYWGYWEKGFTMTSKARGWDENDVMRTRTYRFAVMTEIFDQVKRDLKPAKVRLHVHVAKYNTNKRNDLNRMQQRIENNTQAAQRHFRKYPSMPTRTRTRKPKR